MEFQLWAISSPKRWCGIKVLHSICHRIWKIQQWPQDGKRSVFIPIPKKAMPKYVQTTTQLQSFHMLPSLCSKSFKLGFSNTWTKNFQMYKLDLKKAEEPEIKLPALLDHQKSKRVPEKYLLLLYWLCQRLWLCRSQQTMENSSRDGNTSPPYLPPEKPVCRSRSNS